MLEDLLAIARILLLLWGINLVPPVLAFFFGPQGDAPLDRGRCLKDGRPMFGLNKTLRGLVGALLSGPIFAVILLLPAWLGLTSAAVSMAGDLGTSFLKRRLDRPEGEEHLFLDHSLEGALPLIILGLYLQLSIWQGLLALLLFLAGGRYGSRLSKRCLFPKPSPGSPRPMAPQTRLKELTSCQERPTGWSKLVHFEEAVYYHLVLSTVLRLSGLYEQGRQNALAFEVNRYQASLPNLPDAFEGYRILFLSDLHLDGLSGLTERLVGLMRTIEAELCILGGDYRMASYGSPEAGMPQMRRLIEAISAPDGILAVLGNHDCLEMVGTMEEAGVRFLINEAVEVSRDRDRVFIVGVDDPHYYRCHDLQQAFSGVPGGSLAILAAHSPALFDQAPEFGASLYLTGHTHAGQIQLPWLGMVYTHCPAPRRFCQGPWEHRGMLGYTAAGVGVSGVPVRFNCRGEVVLLRLTKGRKGLDRLRH